MQIIIFIHSFIIGSGGATPADVGQGRGTPRTSRQFVTGLTYTDKQPFVFTFTPTGNLESPVILLVSGLWEEAGVPEENPRRHVENTQTPHGKALLELGIKPRTF